jgi:tetratricopeptide (TPR) repeat protein
VTRAAITPADTPPRPAPSKPDLPKPAAREAELPKPLPTPAAPKISTALAEAHHQRGRELLGQGSYREAIEEFNLAIGGAPDNSIYYNGRGYTYLLLRDTRRALADLDQAILLNPKYLNAYRNRAAARKAAGDAVGSAADRARERALSGK